MSATLRIVGFIPPDDEEWTKMRRIYDACFDAGIEPPEQVRKFFDYQVPCDEGKEVEIKYRESDDNGRWSASFDTKDVDSQIKTIRVYISYY